MYCRSRVEVEYSFGVHNLTLSEKPYQEGSRRMYGCIGFIGFGSLNLLR